MGTNQARNKVLGAKRFLLQAARIMQEHELKLINMRLEQLQDLQNKLAKSEIFQPLQATLNQLTTILTTTKTKGLSKDQYNNFTSLLNLVLSDGKDLQQRLRILQWELNNKSKNFTTIYNQLEEELINTITQLEKNSEIKSINYNNKDMKDIMPELLISYIQQRTKKFTSLKECINWIISASLEFRLYLEQQIKIDSNTTNPFAEVTKDVATIQNYFTTFIKNFDAVYQPVVDFGAIKEAEKNDINADKLIFDLNKDYKFLTDAAKQQPIRQVFVSSTVKSYNLHEFYTQIKNTLVARGLNLGSSMTLGNDNILFYLILKPETSLSKETENTLTSALDTVKGIYKTISKSRHDATEFKKVELEQTKELIQVLNEVEKKVQKDTNLQHLFLIHESVKFYEEIEQGLSPTLSGRTMAIMNYIAEMENIGNLRYPFTKLPFLALNASEETAGKDQNVPAHLQEIFTTAAGLIMFDFPSILAQDVLKKIQLPTITNLHLYNLQGIYYPASYFILAAVERLDALAQKSDNDILRGYGIRTSIDLPQNLKKFYTNLDTSIDRWEDMKQYVETNTKVSIYFFNGFRRFVQSLRIPDFS